MYKYYKQASNTDIHDTNENEVLNKMNLNDNNCILNSEITNEEISKCIKSLKNGKAPGSDKIINEYILSPVAKRCCHFMSVFLI